MADRHPASMLRGRHSECDVLNRLLEAVRAGRSGALVMRGEPGIGKTSLLGYAIEAASELRIMRAVGVESEIELAFAGLHRLFVPMLGRLDGLPDPQRDALQTAFGLSPGAVPDRFLVGLAVLSLLSDAAEERPLLCIVDDAQWLDRASAQALAFAARRLLAESIVMVFATREPSEELKGPPELVVQGLGVRDARELLGSVMRGPMDERVQDRIVAEARGNPLALMELLRGLSPAQLAGGFWLPSELPLSSRIEESFQQRIEALPAESRRLLLLAAADPVGDSALFRRAAERIGLSDDALEPAEADGLLEFGAPVRFRHPLVRSAVYRAAPLEERQSVHRALAEVTDPELDPDRRAWHRAQAVAGPDENVAAELERSADRAQGRGGLAAAAAFLERAVGLTPTPARRARRALAAAHAKHLSGAPDVALQLLTTADAGPLDELGRARVDLLRAQVAYAQNRGSDAPPLLLRAAKRLEPLDVGLARATYLEALAAAQFAGRFAVEGNVVEAAHAALAAPQASQPPRASDLLLDGLATLIAKGYEPGAPMVRRALSAFRSRDMSDGEAQWIGLACRTAVDVWITTVGRSSPSGWWRSPDARAI
jgi:hypothetical protein